VNITTSDSIQALAIIEDDPTVRAGLTEILCTALLKTRVDDYADAETAIKEIGKNPVDMVLCDIGLPGMNGIECIRKLKMMYPAMQIMMLTVYDNPEHIFKAIQAGASSYLLKNTAPDKLVEAVLELHNGGAPMSSQIARQLIEAFRSKSNRDNPYFQNLSRREQEILEMLLQGNRYKEIAGSLFISLETVRSHVRRIYEKLHVNNRIDALKKTGLI
jgi:DNA-binding NarL/FixJ family response regulator